MRSPSLNFFVGMAAHDTAWDWLDDDFRLDLDSPVAISRSLWHDFSQNESVARTLFSSTPESHIKDSFSSAFALGKQDAVDSWHKTSDTNPPLKKGRMLHFAGEEIDVDACLLQPVQKCSDSLIELSDDLLANGHTSSSSMRCLANEESLSSVDDAFEQSAESWMVGCFNANDAKVDHLHVHHRNPLNHAASQIAATRCTGIRSKNRQVLGFKPKEAESSPPDARPKQFPEARGGNPARKHSKGKSLPMKGKPVAYPFALVKPSGMQGDITLKDINERIMAAPIKTGLQGKCERSEEYACSSPFSGRPVVALTKIHTEGKGTITIMRTRS